MVKVKIIGFDLLGEIDKNMLCDILIGHFPCQVIGCMFSAESKYSLLQHYRKEHRLLIRIIRNPDLYTVFWKVIQKPITIACFEAVTIQANQMRNKLTHLDGNDSFVLGKFKCKKIDILLKTVKLTV